MFRRSIFTTQRATWRLSMVRILPYPVPIVDHAERRTDFIAKFKGSEVCSLWLGFRLGLIRERHDMIKTAERRELIATF